MEDAQVIKLMVIKEKSQIMGEMSLIWQKGEHIAV